MRPLDTPLMTTWTACSTTRSPQSRRSLSFRNSRRRCDGTTWTSGPRLASDVGRLQAALPPRPSTSPSGQAGTLGPLCLPAPQSRDMAALNSTTTRINIFLTFPGTTHLNTTTTTTTINNITTRAGGATVATAPRSARGTRVATEIGIGTLTGARRSAPALAISGGLVAGKRPAPERSWVYSSAGSPLVVGPNTTTIT